MEWGSILSTAQSIVLNLEPNLKTLQITNDIQLSSEEFKFCIQQ